VQNILARVVARAPWTVSSLDIRRDLHWLPVTHRINFKLCLLTRKTLHTARPAYLSELITHYLPYPEPYALPTQIFWPDLPASLVTSPLGNSLFLHRLPGTHCLHTSALSTNCQPSNVNQSLISSSPLLPPSHPVSAPQIRSTILALYMYVCMYVCTYV